MAQYDEEFKRAIVKEYLKGASGYKVLSAKFGVNRMTIKGWVKLYRHHGDAGLRKRPSHYSARFKLSVLNQMWQQGLPGRLVLVHRNRDCPQACDTSLIFKP